MKDTSGRRIATAAGDAFRELHRVAYDREARAEIRVEPDLLNSGGPLVRVTMDADRSWRLFTLPNGTGSHQVLRLTGTLGADPADAFPAVGDLVELWRVPEPYTRRVTACDPTATIPDAPRWLSAGTVTTDDGDTHPLRDVRVIERGASAPSMDARTRDALGRLVAYNYDGERRDFDEQDPYSADAVNTLDEPTARTLFELLSRRFAAEALAGFPDMIREEIAKKSERAPKWARGVVTVRFATTDAFDDGYHYTPRDAVAVLADGTSHWTTFTSPEVVDQLDELSDTAQSNGRLTSESVLVVNLALNTVEHA